MSDLEAYGMDLEMLHAMHREWEQGASKSDLERKYLGKPESHGKLFSGLVRRHLGIETEKESELSRENTELRTILRAHGIDPRGAHQPPSSGKMAPAYATSFYGYIDVDSSEARSTLDNVITEIVEPLDQAADSRVELTIEVRATIGRPVDEDLRSTVLESAHDLGLTTRAFEK
jgi:hypothetical protein